MEGCHFAHAEDPQTAERHASECANHINDTCANHHAHAVVDRDALVIEPIGLNKATAARVVLEGIQKSAPCEANSPDKVNTSNRQN
ncbi:hypothetical protein AJ78_08223 [Emergomyces pasteurianus Ep9510]|uniref:Uncharacterized protein n=1 Tax=Emergomyces pasteurianus Ep9510 TaxID=1447872 RepID=A0A1J9P2A0_9EURO|nr:hypothetical protein AJ78_08223 [Emergomyces pasteurianus Ep9510]